MNMHWRARPATSGGKQTLPSAQCGAYSPRTSDSFRPTLKSGDITQALVDSTALLFIFLFIIATALSIPAALFMLFVCDF